MKKLIPSLLIILSLSSCKDDDMESNNWTRYEYLEEARDYIYFKTGTWWVYKKIPGGQLDTIEVIEHKIDTSTLEGRGNKLFYEHLSWIAKSKLDNYIYKFNRGPVTFPPMDYDNEYAIKWKTYWISKSKPGNYMGMTLCFFSPFDESFEGKGGTHKSKLLPNVASLTIQENTYHDVKHFNVSNDATFSWGLPGDEGGIVEYYWAPSVGIIKKEHMTKNISWELIESHVVP